MQYLRYVGAGPSLKTWPKWESQLFQVTSVLTIPCEVSDISFISPALSKKPGHPHPHLYL